MKNENTKVIYFKCKFCKFFNRKDYMLCNMMSLKKGNLCTYGTKLSVWKWIGRIGILSLPVLSIGWYIFIAIPVMFNDHKCISFYLGWILTTIAAILILWIIAAIIFFINEEFSDKGGKYFKKEDRRYKIDEADRSK